MVTYIDTKVAVIASKLVYVIVLLLLLSTSEIYSEMVIQGILIITMTMILKKSEHIEIKILNFVIIICTHLLSILIIIENSYEIVGGITVRVISILLLMSIVHIFANYRSVKIRLFYVLFNKKLSLCNSIFDLFVKMTLILLEELTYRVFFVSVLSNEFICFYSILISSVLFTLHHIMCGILKINIKYITELLLFSILISYLYIKTNSLMVCVMGHFLFNISDIIEDIITIIKKLKE